MLYNVLQTKTYDIGFCMKHIEELKSQLDKDRVKAFESLWKDSQEVLLHRYDPLKFSYFTLSPIFQRGNTIIPNKQSLVFPDPIITVPSNVIL